MVHWLQISAAAAGIGLALAAAPTAFADAGGSSSSAGSARDHSAKAAPTPQRAQSARNTPVAPVRAVGANRSQTASAAAESAASDVKMSAVKEDSAASEAPVAASARQPAVPTALRSAPAAIALKTPTALATSPFGDGLRVLLESASTWLAGFPANPITDALQGAVWAVRRTLFPASVGVVTAPIIVPLTQVAFCLKGTDSDGSCKGGADAESVPRLGIWLTLGSGNTIPQFFEFDTGSAGFLAAYSAEPGVSPWWGSAGVDTTTTSATKSFDSGTTYSGLVAITTVSFYRSATDVTPILTTGNVKVGQVSDMTNGETKLWKPDGPNGGIPPVDGRFYGDFGAGPTYEPNGITSVLNELRFARGVEPGFRVNYEPGVNPGEIGTWTLQIGLTDKDTEDPAGAYFSMVPDASAPVGATNPRSGTRYFAQQLFTAGVTVAIPGTSPLLSTGVGITPDTGADTALHNTNRSTQQNAITYASITDGASLSTGLQFALAGTTASGSSAQFFSQDTINKWADQTAENQGVVSVQNGTSAKDVYYVNTGIQLFFQNDVVYDMRHGQLGLIPVVSN
ncbi:hypothetical protein ACTXG7_27460 [Mycolicibacterium sp. Dal123E01]|uniref:hypothetical protein n=1 Tax=Mycolicibacterium sp. Dal123E01 TaxID=3457578 RepID=UPI00403E6263